MFESILHDTTLRAFWWDLLEPGLLARLEKNQPELRQARLLAGSEELFREFFDRFRRQLRLLADPPAFARLVRPCTVGDGIVRLAPERLPALLPRVRTEFQRVQERLLAEVHS